MRQRGKRLGNWRNVVAFAIGLAFSIVGWAAARAFGEAVWSVTVDWVVGLIGLAFSFSLLTGVNLGLPPSIRNSCASARRSSRASSGTGGTRAITRDDAAGAARLDGQGGSAVALRGPYVRRRLSRPALQRRPPTAEVPRPAVLNLAVYRGTALSDAQVRCMVRWGWEIGSHTLGHPIPTRVSAATLRRELVLSRRILHHQFDVPVDFLCYPGGIYDRRVMRAARDAGYLAATSIRYGAATPYGRFALPRFALPRIAVYWGESLATFGSRMRETVARAR